MGGDSTTVGWQRLVISPRQYQGEYIQLTGPQQHYLQRVLRLTIGDCFVALDGQGREWVAALTDAPEVAAVRQLLAVDAPVQPEIILAAALPKGSGFDQVVRQATELGVTCVQPVMSGRTLLKPSPKRLERWRRIAIEASEQSERRIVPVVNPPLPWSEWKTTVSGSCYFCVARGTAPHLLACLPPLPTTITIAVGPEGGWTEAECADAIATGFQPVSLGPQVLRAVTAPLAALTLVQAALSLGETAHHPTD